MMGQAKQRGTYEKRKAEGIVKRQKREIEQEAARLERIKQIDEELKARRSRSRSRVDHAGITAAILLSTNYLYRG